MSIYNMIFSIVFSLQKEKNKEQEEEEEEIGGNSEFMKLAKKVTVKSLQKKGELDFYWSDKKRRGKGTKTDLSPMSLPASPAVVPQDTTLLPRNPFEAFKPAGDIQVGTNPQKWHFPTQPSQLPLNSGHSWFVTSE